MDRATLVQQIREQFAKTSRGLGTTLHEAIGLDRWLNGDDLSRERTRDTDVRWWDVPDADIESSPEIFSYLDSRGFAYYLPAYMVWSLQNFDCSLSSSSDTVVYTLCATGPFGDKRRSYFNQLTPGQKAVTAEFLAFMSRQSKHADSDAAEEALDAYWREYLENDGEHGD